MNRTSIDFRKYNKSQTGSVYVYTYVYKSMCIIYNYRHRVIFESITKVRQVVYTHDYIYIYTCVYTYICVYIDIQMY